jgi:hypothetical protein
VSTASICDSTSDCEVPLVCAFSRIVSIYDF